MFNFSRGTKLALIRFLESLPLVTTRSYHQGQGLSIPQERRKAPNLDERQMGLSYLKTCDPDQRPAQLQELRIDYQVVNVNRDDLQRIAGGLAYRYAINASLCPSMPISEVTTLLPLCYQYGTGTVPGEVPICYQVTSLLPGYQPVTRLPPCYQAVTVTMLPAA